MGFYEELSRYYDVIFPLEKTKLDFINSRIRHGSKVLDIACGTGNYSIALGDLGYCVDGIDLDTEMIKQALEKSKDKDMEVNFVKGSMLDIDKIFYEKLFHFVFSIGNSIVHLANEDEIKELLHKIYNLMASNSTLILQIVNYDRILDNNIDHLPTIKNEKYGVSFTRNYRYNGEEKKIYFDTEIIKDSGNKKIVYHNSVKLYPLRSLRLKTILEEIGFNSVSLYGDFHGGKHTEESYATIAEAIR